MTKHETREMTRDIDALFQEFKKEPVHQLNIAFSLMGVIPLLVVVYLLGAKFFSLSIFAGSCGAVILSAIILSCAGYIMGYNITRNILQRISNYAITVRTAFTELKETQAMLIRSEQFRIIGQLASGVAHEVKNPLGVILQNINYLEDVLDPDEEMVKVLTMMKRNVKRADTIIKALLDFSRTSKLEIKPNDINQLLEGSVGLVMHKVRSDEVRFKKELAPGLPKVPVDALKLEQVFVNILVNALQVLADGGTILIRTSLQTLGEKGHGIGTRSTDRFKIGDTAVLVEIEDSGPGISQDHLDRIFEPFFTTKEVGKGTGLGLSVSRNIVELHRGMIYIDSDIGKGTKVSIVLKPAGEE